MTTDALWGMILIAGGGALVGGGVTRLTRVDERLCVASDFIVAARDELERENEAVV